MLVDSYELVRHIVRRIRKEDPRAELEYAWLVTTGYEDLASTVAKYIGVRPRGFVKIVFAIPLDGRFLIKTLYMPVLSWTCYRRTEEGLVEEEASGTVPLIEVTRSGRVRILSECIISTVDFAVPKTAQSARS